MQCTVHSHTRCYFFCRSNVTFIVSALDSIPHVPSSPSRIFYPNPYQDFPANRALLLKLDKVKHPNICFLNKYLFELNSAEYN